MGRSSRLARYGWSRARVSARSTTWDASASSWPTCFGLAEWRIWVPRTLEQAVAVGYGSLFIVLLVSAFAGAVTSLQTGYQFTGTLPLYYAGAVISESMILELGPVL